MTMTRKDYQAVAKIIGGLAVLYPANGPHIALDIGRQLADYFKAESPLSFDEDRFMRAIRDAGDRP